ncbi:putative protein EXORDIUM [Helianthus annuus]|nr:putative protein EXORDIUM [Helianthus annuus]
MKSDKTPTPHRKFTLTHFIFGNSVSTATIIPFSTDSTLNSFQLIGRSNDTNVYDFNSTLSLIGLVLIGNVRAEPSEQFPVVLKYHMGPVLSNNITVHLIWYGSWSSGEKRIIREFISSLSASQCWM